jgi:hypothetical protein
MSKIKILFSPSESKREGGESRVIDASCFIFPELLESRKMIYDKYLDFVKNGSPKVLSEIFGLKSEADIATCKSTILDSKLMLAIERYDGVAFEYLDFASFEENAREYVLQSTIIFSNIFGPIGAGDMIPNYKLKQGMSFDGLKIEEHYKNRFSSKLDEYLTDSFVLDLRAGYYDKFYKPSNKFTTLKFLLNGKVVSHYAKAYRGLILREIATKQIDSKEAFMSMELENLKVVEIKKISNKEEVVFEIIPQS